VLPALGLSLALGLWTGSAFGDPKWTNPRAMLTLGGRLLASGLLLLQAAGWLGLAAVGEFFGENLPAGFRLWGPIALAIPLAALPLRAAAARLRNLEWSY